MRTTTTDPLPHFESFRWGFYTCARCLDTVSAENRESRALKEPVRGLAKGEILIPAGRHSFHPRCWDGLRKAAS